MMFNYDGCVPETDKVVVGLKRPRRTLESLLLFARCVRGEGTQL